MSWAVLVSTPFQLMAAAECVGQTLGSLDRARLLLAMGSGWQRQNDSQSVDTAAALGWEIEDRLPLTLGRGRSRRLLSEVRSTRRALGLLSSSTHLVLGNPGSRLQRACANARNWQQVIVTDDGLASYNAWRAGRFGKHGCKPSTAVGRVVSGEARLRLNHAAQWFTIFGEVEGDAVRTHRFEFVRSRFAETLEGREEPGALEGAGLVFLGQPIVESRRLSEEQYASILSRLGAQVEGPGYYVPHRREVAGQASVRARNAGLRLLPLELPVELEVMRAGVPPAMIAGVSSSGLVTCHRLFADEGVRVVRVPLEEELSCKSRTVDLTGPLAGVPSCARQGP